MPIQLKTVKSVDFLTGLGLPHEVFQKAATLAWTFGPQVISVRNTITETTLTIACKLSQAKAIADHTATTLVKMSTRERVILTVASLLGDDGVEHYAKIADVTNNQSQAASAALLASHIHEMVDPALEQEDGTVFQKPAPKPQMASPPKGPFASLGHCTLAEMREDPAVPLIQASRILQPVKASSADSRYFVIALRADIKIAARWRNNRVSLRAEGHLSGYATNLQSCGFTLNSGYASVHFDVTDDVLARKTIGAVLFGLGLAWSQVVTVPQVLHNEGK